MKIFFNSLIFKIGVIIILAEILVLAVVGSVYINRFNNAIDERTQAQVTLPATLMNRGLLSLATLAEQDTMKQLVGESLIEGWAVDEDGDVFASVNPEYRGQKIDDIPDIDRSAFDFEKPRSRVMSTDSYVTSIAPIYRSGETTPRLYLYIKVGTSEAEAEKAETRNIFLLGSVLTVIFTSLIILLSFRFTIQNRITHVLRILEQVESGNLGVRVHGDFAFDELGILQRRVNSMVETLEHRNTEREQIENELKQYRDHLEIMVRARTHQLEVVATVSEKLNAILDIDKLLNELTNQIRDNFDYYQMNIFLTNMDAETLSLVTSTTNSDHGRIPPNLVIPIDTPNNLIAQAARQGEVVNQKVGNPEATSRQHAEIAIPIMHNRRVVGVLDVQQAQLGQFDEGDMNSLRSLAGQLAVSLRNAQLFKQNQLALTEMETLYTLSQRLLQTDDLSNLVGVIMESMAPPTISRAALFVFEYEPNKQLRAMISHATWHNGYGKAPTPIGTRYEASAYEVLKLFISKEPLYFENIQEDERADEATRRLNTQLKIKAMAVLPLWSQGQQIGVLLLEGEEPYQFTAKEIRSFLTLSGHLASIVENRLLVEQLEKQVRRRTTELNTTNLALQERERTLRQLSQAIEQSPVAVFITDTDGLIQYANPKYTQITGYTYDEILGQKPKLFEPNEHPIGYFDELWQTISSGREWQGEFHNKKKNGETYWALATITGVKDVQGNITHYVAIKEDITKRKQLEEEKVRQERLAAVGQLAAGIAHDFNNVMAIISLDSSILLRTATLTEKERAKLNRIEQQAYHAANLIQQILDFSRRSKREPQHLDLKIWLKEMVKFMERTIPERIQLQYSLGEGELTANVDPTQMQQVITNLAVNARDAIQGTGKLYFDLTQVHFASEAELPTPDLHTGTWLKLSIRDTGGGIPPETLPHIFEPFFTTKEVGKGTGLGLAQVHGIIQQHEGHILVESELGVGTTFIIYLPSLGDNSTLSHAGIEPPIEQGRGQTILLVEDNLDLLDSIGAVLMTLNYNVLFAENGEHALSVYEEYAHQIDLVLSDVVMPQIDGFELVRRLQRFPTCPKIILMSGFPREIEMADGIEHAILDWIKKPLSIPRLAEILASVFNEI